MGKLSKLKSLLDNRKVQQVGAASIVATQSDEADASFIGPTSKLFDQVGHAFAVKMKEAGLPDKEIFEKTGLFEGADGKWRQEVDDSQRTFTPTRTRQAAVVDSARNEMETALQARAKWVSENKLKFKDSDISEEGIAALKSEYDQLQQAFREKQQKFVKLENSDVSVGTVGDALDATVIDAYPELKKMPFDHADLPFETRGGYSPGQGVMVNRGISPKAQESTVMHEVQHAIQDKEGFNMGDSFAAHVNELEQKRDFTLRQIEDLNFRLRDLVRQSEEATSAGDFTRVGQLERKYNETFAQRKGLTKQVTESGINDPEALRAQAYKNYQNVAGEVEARNVQFRQDMTPNQRRQSYPPGTEDVAREDQIVKLNGPNGQQLAESFAQKRAAKSPRWREMRERKGKKFRHGLGSVGPAALDLAGEFMAGVNRGAVDTANFLGPDQVNAALQLSGSDKRIPTFDDIPGVAEATQGGFMEDGTPQQIVRTAGEFMSPL